MDTKAKTICRLYAIECSFVLGLRNLVKTTKQYAFSTQEIRGQSRDLDAVGPATLAKIAITLSNQGLIVIGSGSKFSLTEKGKSAELRLI
jgi:Mn-dependent DtxR family transcriptional regulator